jgi:diguanylate cyclase (GGDEF)-like protein
MRILVAEDNPVFQSMLKHMLERWGYEVTLAGDGTEAWKLLQTAESPRLAILDWMMPGMDGPDVCRRVRAAALEPYVYVLLLTARTEQRDLVEGMEAGADDYVTKPFSAQELRVRLRAGTRLLELQAELLRAREALREQATRDALTGTWNRGSLFEILQKELARATRTLQPLGVLMADLDHFKQVNDIYGHSAGDAVLREAARRMTAGIRSYDALGRYGGEEFVIVLPGCDGEGAARQAERLREAIGTEPFRVPEGTIKVTCSIGVTWAGTPEALQTDILLRRADTALYVAKNNGRNRVEICGPDKPVSSGLPLLAAAIAR